MNRFPFEAEDDDVEIINEDVIEFQFTNFTVSYNKTYGFWYATYYEDGDETQDAILDRDSIPSGIDLTPEDFDMLTEALKDILKEE